MYICGIPIFNVEDFLGKQMEMERDKVTERSYRRRGKHLESKTINPKLPDTRDSKPTNQNQNLRFRIKTHKPNQICDSK
jgi:hypothetical protein